jgi:cephalosporin hydroxylase
MSRSVTPSLAAVACFVFLAAGVFAGRWWERQPARVRDNFHLWYHRTGAEQQFGHTSWLGVPVQKLPFDTWVIQEILWELRPDVIVETGTYKGGSAYYYATLFDAIGHGRILTVDIEPQPDLPQHPRITYLVGSSTAPETVERIRQAVGPSEKVLVFLDSAHEAEHVAEEIRLYAPLVSPGSYLIVEDTHFNGNPVLPNFGPGPWEAVDEFLASTEAFVPDRSREKLGISFNPRGYLRRVQ